MNEIGNRMQGEAARRRGPVRSSEPLRLAFRLVVEGWIVVDGSEKAHNRDLFSPANGFADRGGNSVLFGLAAADSSRLFDQVAKQEIAEIRSVLCLARWLTTCIMRRLTLGYK